MLSNFRTPTSLWRSSSVMDGPSRLNSISCTAREGWLIPEDPGVVPGIEERKGHTLAVAIQKIDGGATFAMTHAVKPKEIGYLVFAIRNGPSALLQAVTVLI